MNRSIVISGIVFFLFLPQQSDGQKVGLDPVNILERFHVPSDGDALIVPVQFQGKTYPFLLDTGASVTMFDSSLESQLGKTIGGAWVKGPRGMKFIKLYASPKAHLGKLSLQTKGPVVSLDLTKFREVSGEPIFGIIGMDFLSQKVIHIDFDKGTLSILKKKNSSGKGFKISYTQGLPHVRAHLPGHVAEEFLLDLGKISTGGGDLRATVLATLKKQKKAILAGQALGETVSGTDGLSVFQVEMVSLGEFALPKIHFDQAEKSSVGTGFLSRFNVTLDFLNHEMHLEKGKQFHRSDNLDMSGLHILRKKGKTIVHSIDAGSPADLQGMKARDVVEKIGVLDAGQTRLFVLRNLLSSEGKEVPVTLVRSKRSIPWPLDSIPVLAGASGKRGESGPVIVDELAKTPSDSNRP